MILKYKMKNLKQLTLEKTKKYTLITDQSENQKYKFIRNENSIIFFV